MWGPTVRISHLRDELARLVGLDVVSGYRGERRRALVRYALSGRLRGLAGIYVENSSRLPSETDLAFLGWRGCSVGRCSPTSATPSTCSRSTLADSLKRRLARAAFLPRRCRACGPSRRAWRTLARPRGGGRRRSPIRCSCRPAARRPVRRAALDPTASSVPVRRPHAPPRPRARPARRRGRARARGRARRQRDLRLAARRGARRSRDPSWLRVERGGAEADPRPAARRPSPPSNRGTGARTTTSPCRSRCSSTLPTGGRSSSPTASSRPPSCVTPTRGRRRRRARRAGRWDHPPSRRARRRSSSAGRPTPGPPRSRTPGRSARAGSSPRSSRSGDARRGTGRPRRHRRARPGSGRRPERPSLGAFVRDRASGVRRRRVVHPRPRPGPWPLVYARMFRDAMRVRRIRGVEAHVVAPTGLSAGRWRASGACRWSSTRTAATSATGSARQRRDAGQRGSSRRHVDRVVTNSDDSARHIRRMGIEPIVAPPGVDLSRFVPTARPERRSVLYLGGRNPAQGIRRRVPPRRHARRPVAA